MVEFSKLEGHVLRALNSTIMTLILKCNKHSTFNDFKPIALCNLAYNIITKIITNELKCFLSRGVSKEQFGFLVDMQIIDVIGITQEVIHFFKHRDMEAC